MRGLATNHQVVRYPSMLGEGFSFLESELRAITFVDRLTRSFVGVDQLEECQLRRRAGPE
jgi:hypothetical protein